MQFNSVARYTTSTVVIVAVFTGCSGAHPSAAGPTSILPVATVQSGTRDNVLAPRGMHQRDPGSVAVGLYVSLPLTNQVSGYNGADRKNKGSICTISSGLNLPLGIATDGSGNLYVANYATGYYGAGYISVYAPNCGAQIGNVSVPYGTGLQDVVIKGNTWYALNQYGTGSNSANVAVCSASGCSTDLVPRAPGMGELLGVAVDKNGNVYADGYSKAPSSFPTLEVWHKGVMPGHIKCGYLPFANTLEIDNNDHLLIGQGSVLLIVDLKSDDCKLREFVVHSNVADIKLNAKNTLLYVGNQNNPGSVDEYRYQGFKGVTFLRSITTGIDTLAYGVAPIPPRP